MIFGSRCEIRDDNGLRNKQHAQTLNDLSASLAITTGGMLTLFIAAC